MWRAFSVVAKVIVTGALIYLMLHWVHFTTVAAKFSNINLYWFSLELLVLMVQVPLLSLRWREIVLLCDLNLKFTLAFRYIMISMFFNQLLPSTVGGDAARIWLLARQSGGWRAAAYSVLVDRVVGVMALAAIVIVCLPWSLHLISDPVGRTSLVVVGIGCFSASLLFCCLGSDRLTFMQRWAVTRQLANAASVAWRIPYSGRLGVFIAISSILIHVLTVTAAWCGAKAVGAPLSFPQALFLMPTVLLITVVPISIAGWGVRETAMVLAFSYAGLAESDGLVVSFLLGIGTLIVGILGGLVWLLGSDRRSMGVEGPVPAFVRASGNSRDPLQQ